MPSGHVSSMIWSSVSFGKVSRVHILRDLLRIMKDGGHLIVSILEGNVLLYATGCGT